VRWTAKADDEILLAAEQHHHIGVAEFRRGAIQAALEITKNVRVIVGNQAARLFFRNHRQASGFEEVLHCLTGERVTCGAAGDEQWSLRLAQEGNSLPYSFRIASQGCFRPVGIGRGENHVILFDAALLHVDRNRQMNRSAPPAESQAHGAGDEFRNASRVVDHE
jgi:hypothetical protein